jgi:uncharacterized protein YbjT (DUF2867 family)
MKTAIVIGATGLVGSELLTLLLASAEYASVLVLSRRSSRLAHAKLTERRIDFDAPDLRGITGDDFFCAFGTTLRKAGSKEAQRRIDCDYPTTLASLLKRQGVRRMFLVSSLGADANARSFYLNTKGKLECNIIGLDFDRTVIVRPSVLVGNRPEFRRGEEMAIRVMSVLSPLLRGRLAKYRPIEASAVARCLLQQAASHTSGLSIIESDQLRTS